MSNVLNYQEEQLLFKEIDDYMKEIYKIGKDINIVPENGDRSCLIEFKNKLQNMNNLEHKEKINRMINLVDLIIANKNKIFLANDRLVKNITLFISKNKKTPYYDDMLQESYLGLLRAIDKFDYTKQLKFSTYAYMWIKQGSMRFLSENSRTIRLPCYLLEIKTKINKLQENYISTYNRLATKQEIIKELGLTHKQYKVLEEAQKNEVCQNFESQKDNNVRRDLSFIKKVENSLLYQFSPQKVDDKIEINNIKEIIKKLHPMEAMVICLRYGISLDDFDETCDEYTYQRIAKIIKKNGSSIEFVRKIEKKALSKIKKRLNKKGKTL